MRIIVGCLILKEDKFVMSEKLNRILSGCGSCFATSDFSEHPKNKCLSQTTPFKVWWHIVFLIVREAKKDCYGKWNLPLGKLEEGEKIIDGAKRESEEETGLKLELKGLIGIYQHKSNTDGQEVIKLIFEASSKGTKFNFPKEEILDAKWITLKEFNDIPEREIRVLDIKTAVNYYFSRGSINLNFVRNLEN